MTTEQLTLPTPPFPDCVTMGDDGNTFEIVINPDMPEGTDMMMHSPNQIHFSTRLSPTERSLLLMRFFVNITYQVGKKSSAIQGEMSQADLDGLCVGLWQWLSVSGINTTCSPAMSLQWIANKRQEIAST